jgi:hypothetical protein
LEEKLAGQSILTVILDIKSVHPIMSVNNQSIRSFTNYNVLEVGRQCLSFFFSETQEWWHKNIIKNCIDGRSFNIEFLAKGFFFVCPMMPQNGIPGGSSALLTVLV